MILLILLYNLSCDTACVIKVHNNCNTNFTKKKNSLVGEFKIQKSIKKLTFKLHK